MVNIGFVEEEGAAEKQRTRKRPRLAWDAAPPPPPPPPQPEARVRQHRVDDRDGHYVFNLGEDLTPRSERIPRAASHDI